MTAVRIVGTFLPQKFLANCFCLTNRKFLTKFKATAQTGLLQLAIATSHLTFPSYQDTTKPFKAIVFLTRVEVLKMLAALHS
jgi:hypothetical protein